MNDSFRTQSACVLNHGMLRPGSRPRSRRKRRKRLMTRLPGRWGLGIVWSLPLRLEGIDDEQHALAAEMRSENNRGLLSSWFEISVRISFWFSLVETCSGWSILPDFPQDFRDFAHVVLVGLVVAQTGKTRIPVLSPVHRGVGDRSSSGRPSSSHRADQVDRPSVRSGSVRDPVGQCCEMRWVSQEVAVFVQADRSFERCSSDREEANGRKRQEVKGWWKAVRRTRLHGTGVGLQHQGGRFNDGLIYQHPPTGC